MMEHEDKTREIIDKIILERKHKKDLKIKDVMWVWRRFMYYTAISLAHGNVINISKRLKLRLMYIKLDRGYGSNQKRRIKGIKAYTSKYFRFHLEVFGELKKYRYKNRNTRWMYKTIKKSIDMDVNLEIVTG